MDDELPDYEAIVSFIHRCPVTWLGGILAEAAGRAAMVPVFANDEALMRFVTRAVERAKGMSNAKTP